jgi:aminopeptidase N
MVQPPPVQEDGRLPVTVTPLHYAVTLDVDPSQERFTGKVTIDIDAPIPLSYVVLNGRDLAIKTAVATVGGVQLPSAISTRKSHGGVAPEEIVLEFPRPIPAGRGSLVLTYDAPFGRELSGLYRVTEGGRSYAFTQFEATAARRAFPCFDEPAMKAPFDLEITTPKGMIAVANTPETTRVDVGGKTRFDFARTPPLSTYLLAFAVGDFDVVDGGKVPIPVRLIAVKGKGPLGGTALGMAPGIVKALGDYFAVPYPFPKLDLVAVPDFAAGAMENPGLITFREELLLMDPAHASSSDTHSAASVLGHELAHIWFGDLVTMQWWNDVWLNEGFANWMEAKALDTWRPEYRQHLSSVGRTLAVMELDALASAHPVRRPVVTSSDIEESFDGISYDKGSAILSMIERWVGPDVFQRGVREYIQAHSWKNARAEDLWAALDHASGRDVTGMATTFIDRAGVPSVAFTAGCNAGAESLDLTQSAFHPLGIAAKPTDDTPWHVPVCVHAVSAPADDCADLTAAHGSLALAKASCGTPVFPNAGAAGYFRFSLPEKDVKALARDAAHLDVASRMALASNVWAMVRAGELVPSAALDVLPAFDKETDQHVVWEEIRALYGIDHALVDDGSRPAYRAYVAARLAGEKRRLGWKPKAGDSDDTKQLRSDVVMALGDLARDEGTLHEAEALAKSWLRDPRSVDPDLAPAAVFVGSIRGGVARLNELRAAAKAAKVPSDRIIALRAMSAFDDKNVLAQAFDLMITDEVKMQDLRYLLGGFSSPWNVFERTDRARALFAWLSTHWDAMRAKVPDGFGSYDLVTEVRGTCTTEERDKETDFLKPRMKDIEGATLTLAESSEAATACAALRARAADEVTAYFAKGGSKGR